MVKVSSQGKEESRFEEHNVKSGVNQEQMHCEGQCRRLTVELKPNLTVRRWRCLIVKVSSQGKEEPRYEHHPRSSHVPIKNRCRAVREIKSYTILFTFKNEKLSVTVATHPICLVSEQKKSYIYGHTSLPMQWSTLIICWTVSYDCTVGNRWNDRPCLYIYLEASLIIHHL